MTCRIATRAQHRRKAPLLRRAPGMQRLGHGAENDIQAPAIDAVIPTTSGILSAGSFMRRALPSRISALTMTRFSRRTRTAPGKRRRPEKCVFCGRAGLDHDLQLPMPGTLALCRKRRKRLEGLFTVTTRSLNRVQSLRSRRPGKARPRCLEKQNALLENQASGDDTSDIHAAPGPYLTSTPSPLRPFLRRALRRECWPWRSCLRGRHIRRWAGRSCASEQQR